MIDPESLDLKLLPWLPLDAKSDFPTQSAIYFAIDSQGIIQYIGRAENPRQRWKNHHKIKKLIKIGSIRMSYLFLDADLLPEVEKALIAWFKPRLNGKEIMPERKEFNATKRQKFRDLKEEYQEFLEKESQEFGYITKEHEKFIIHFLPEFPSEPWFEGFKKRMKILDDRIAEVKIKLNIKTEGSCPT
jgi:hypothetical protein